MAPIIKKNNLPMLLLLGALLAANSAGAAGPRYDVVRSLKQEIRHTVASQTSNSYFLVMFSYQGARRSPTESHTFSAYVQANQHGIQRWTSLAWLPKAYAQTRKICIFDNLAEAARHEVLGSDCVPVEGRNYSTEATLQMVQGTGKDLAVWGPYRITREFYDAGIYRAQDLGSGVIKYMADDRKTRLTGEAVNCLHAVSDVFVPVSRSIASKYGFWGHAGTMQVLSYFARWGRGHLLDPIHPRRYREIRNY